MGHETNREFEFNDELGDFQVFIDEGEPNPLWQEKLTEQDFFEKIVQAFEKDESINPTFEMLGAGCFIIWIDLKPEPENFSDQRIAWVNPDRGILSGRMDQVITFEDEDAYQVGLYTGDDMESPSDFGEHLIVEGFDNMVEKVREWVKK